MGSSELAQDTNRPRQDADLTAVAAPRRPRQQQNIIRLSIGIRCSNSGCRANFQAPATRATACRRASRARSSGSTSVEDGLAVTRATSSATRGHAHHPEGDWGHLPPPRWPGSGVCNPDRPWAQMASAIGKLDTARSFELCSATGRIAQPSLAANCPLPSRPARQGVERNIVITMWDWGDCPRPIFTTGNLNRASAIRPLNANGLIYGALEESSGTSFRSSTRPAMRRTRSKCRYASPNTPSSKDNLRGPLSLLGRCAHLGQPDNMHMRSEIKGQGGARWWWVCCLIRGTR